VFRVTRTIGAPRRVAGDRDSVVVPANSRVFVVTGIARPDRFISDILSVGWDVCGSIEFRDHHRFAPRDIRRIAAEAKATGSMIILTTEKDAVRLAACDIGDLPIASIPLLVGVEPSDAFQTWLLDRIRNPQSAIRNPQSR
jgi:tetraacyldisaccharide-1-P 4'-kinase